MTRERVAHWMRLWADRIDHAGAAKMTGLTLTLEQGKGWTLRGDGRGMGVWYLGDDEYDKAHTQADNPPRRIDWTTGTVHAPGTSLRP